MRSWLLSALIGTSLAMPAYGAQGSSKPKGQEKKEAKEAQQAVKDARKHAKKADELPHEQARKADEEGQKANKKAQKKPGPVGTSGGGMRFHGLDKNANGVIERAEWRGNERSFANEDWNRDGVLSGDEVRPGAVKPGTAPRGGAAVPRPGGDSDEVLFARLDRNRDGFLSRGEWQAAEAEFVRLDFDRDGRISPYEFGVGR